MENKVDEKQKVISDPESDLHQHKCNRFILCLLLFSFVITHVLHIILLMVIENDKIPTAKFWMIIISYIINVFQMAGFIIITNECLPVYDKQKND
jgi:ABC-type methionine transport system permease subunit